MEWIDTDASGHWHNTSALRMAEAAEVALLERLGILGPTYYDRGLPRVQINAHFYRPLHFNDVAEVSVEVAGVGGASITYRCEIALAGKLSADIELVAVLRGADGRAERWPDDLRQLLLTAGPQEPLLLTA